MPPAFNLSQDQTLQFNLCKLLRLTQVLKNLTILDYVLALVQALVPRNKRLHLSVVFSVKDQLLSDSEPGNVSGLFSLRFVVCVSSRDANSIRTDPETVNTRSTLLQKMRKTRQTVELTGIFLKILQNCTCPNSRKTPQQIFFQHGQFLLRRQKSAKQCGFGCPTENPPRPCSFLPRYNHWHWDVAQLGRASRSQCEGRSSASSLVSHQTEESWQARIPVRQGHQQPGGFWTAPTLCRIGFLPLAEFASDIRHFHRPDPTWMGDFSMASKQIGLHPSAGEYTCRFDFILRCTTGHTHDRN